MAMALAEAVESTGSVGNDFAGRLEVLEGPTGRRRWPDDVKARVVVESFQPDVLVSAVARRHGISSQQLTGWRRAARSGRLVLPWAAEGPGFVPVVVEGDSGDAGADEAPAPAIPSPGMSGVIEVELPGVVLRLPAETAPAGIAAVVSALKALP